MTDRIDYAGRIVSAEFARGKEWRTDDCEGCYCECHDALPKPPGTYITVKLDDDTASVGPMRVVVTKEADHG